MKRWQADFLLGLTGLIWGFGFVAQKDASAHIGAFTFVACRFLISALFVLPFVAREGGFRRFLPTLRKTGYTAKTIALCLAFFAAVTLQQYGAFFTTVTNAAFLTGIYIVMVPFVGLLLYRHGVSPGILFVACLSLLGIGLLTGVDMRHLLAGFNHGDVFMLLCAVCFAFQVSIMGHVVGATHMPFTLSFIQYLSTGLAALALAACYETFDLHVILSAWMPILYTGIASGGIAYTFQAVAQQHTPSADSSIIMGSGETLFGALGGAWLLNETMNLSGYVGCAMILASIILVELIPYLHTKLSRA